MHLILYCSLLFLPREGPQIVYASDLIKPGLAPAGTNSHFFS